MDDGSFLSAGYFLTRPVACGWLEAEPGEAGRVDRRLWTLNEHVAPTLPSSCFLEGSEPWPGEREQARRGVLQFFSISPDRVEEVRRFSVDPARADAVDWDSGGGSIDLVFVRDAARRFLPAGSDAVLLGLSAAAADVPAIERCFDLENDRPDVPAWIRRQAPPEPGGRVVGFDPAPILRECAQRACSWICEGLDWEEVARDLGVRLNGHGLLDTYDQARRACAWLRDRGNLCGGDRWFPWRLSVHPAAG